MPPGLCAFCRWKQVAQIYILSLRHVINKVSTSRVTMLTQTIEERYVDMKKLDKLLKELFGQQKCEVEVSSSFPIHLKLLFTLTKHR